MAVGPPGAILADAGFASGPAVAAPEARGIEPLAAVGWTQPRRPDDFRLLPPPKTAWRITEPWRFAMQAKLGDRGCQSPHACRKKAVEPVFRTVESTSGIRRSHCRGLRNVASAWTLIALACNRRRLHRPQAG